jgi:two-component system sensor histidine kinase ChiS
MASLRFSNRPPWSSLSMVSGKLPLRMVLVASFVLQISAAVGLTAWISYRNGQKAVTLLANQLSQENSARIEEHLSSYLFKTDLFQNNSRSLIQSQDVSATDLAALERHFWHQMQATDGISSIYFANPEGEFVGIQKRDDGQQVLWYMNKSMVPERITYRLNDQGVRLDKLRTQNYDPRSRPWYKAAVEAHHPIWSPIYRFASQDYSRLGITPAVPVYDRQGKLLGVLAIDLTLEQLSKFLRQLKISRSGQAFVVERSGAIVASSADEEPFISLGDEQSRLLAIDSKEPLIQATAQHLIEQFGSLDNITGAEQMSFRLDGNRQLVQVLPFADERELNWLIVTVIPERDFMGQVNANTRMTILLCLLSLAIATLIAIATARWVISPIWRLNQTASEISQGNWEQPLPEGRFQEVSELTESFRRMVAQLKISFEALEEQNAELHRFDKLKDEFLANTSHELKTPLHGIIGLAESLMEGATGPLPHRTKANLAMIVASGRQLFTLVNDLLDFSQLRHNTVELRLSSVGIREAADVVITLSRPMAQQKGLQLINAVSPRLPLVLADEDRLQQILHNLVSNAVKFTEQGMIGVSAQIVYRRSPHSGEPPRPMESAPAIAPLSISESFQAGNIPFAHPNYEVISQLQAEQEMAVFNHHTYLAVTVSDTGIGIAADQLERIFQPFEQGNGSTARLYGGMGVGLAVTKKLVELHGGNIWVTSNIGIGSQFTFTLPVASGVAMANLPLVPTTTTEAPTPSRLRGSPGWASGSKTLATTIANLNDLTVMSNGQTNGQTNGQSSSQNNGQSNGCSPQSGPRTSSDRERFKVLVVDDEPVNRQVILNHLTVQSYEVIGASSGIEALKHMEEGLDPDIILLDVMMPGLTGYEVCRMIRETHPANELPIVMLTAKNQVADLVEGLSAGANDYIAKPVSKKELLARLETHLHLSKINQAYSRFVPREFLQLLNKTSILDVHLGDQVQQKMSVMFADILDFTSLSEQMPPDENFRFINAFLSRMEPAIAQNHGFIDKYIGDAIMALFTQGADDALRSSIDMLRRLELYNRERRGRGYAAIALGIGINTGQLMLGTVGGKNRMDNTVISDTVNVAARIERLTRTYRVSLLISHHTFLELEDANQYAMRVIDRVQVKGKSTFVSVYEVFEGDVLEIKDAKLATKTIFETAILQFYQKNFQAAADGFAACLDKNPLDAVAQVYLERCQQSM